ncbi:protein unc-13 homolog [Helianthus annuus]|uniref:protein unc-13 homolog n=1 Tax=Helianthus annuus TaxID=4232 RepID=UPI0016532C55|nr:protein unc-13 homolog [Helianthus annuus]
MADENSPSSRDQELLKPVATTVDHDGGASSSKPSPASSSPSHNSGHEVGRRVEMMVLPLELLQQFKPSDFTDQQEYDTWQKRNLKMLEAGLLLHPHVPLGNATTASQRLQKIIRNALEKPIETGRNTDPLQVLRGAVMSLANRSTCDNRTTYTNSGSDSEENVDDDPRERQSTGDGIGDDSAMR